MFFEQYGLQLALACAFIAIVYGIIAARWIMHDLTKDRIQHFFEHYKDLEKGKWVKVSRWADPEEACELIRQSIANLGKE